MKKKIEAKAAMKCTVTIPPIKLELTTIAPNNALINTAKKPNRE